LTSFSENLTLFASINRKENIMQTTISSKYQVVIPKPVRERLDLKPQQKLTVIEKDRMLILLPHTSLDELRGIAAGARTSDYREKKDRGL
jgi:AbrB family looped-hinge helix DNA binding protein